MFRYGALVVAATVVLVMMAGCTIIVPNARVITASGKQVTQTYDLEGFTAIDINNAFRATVNQGDTYAVTVSADENLWPYLLVEKDGDTLRAHFRTPTLALNFTSHAITITMPSLAGVKANGASRVEMGDFTGGERFEADLNGASRMEGKLEAITVSLKANGASGLTLAGTADGLDLVANGASKVELRDLAVREATVDLNGASGATVNASDNLTCSLNGASRLSYLGRPRLDARRVEGASSLAPVD